MQIALNGAEKETSAATVEALVTELGLKRGTVLVEHNGTALHPNEWAQTSVAEGDRVEILRIVAGG
jgi:thiamine biosynthesis protein ThiS